MDESPEQTTHQSCGCPVVPGSENGEKPGRELTGPEKVLMSLDEGAVISLTYSLCGRVFPPTEKLTLAGKPDSPVRFWAKRGELRDYHILSHHARIIELTVYSA